MFAFKSCYDKNFFHEGLSSVTFGNFGTDISPKKDNPHVKLHDPAFFNSHPTNPAHAWPLLERKPFPKKNTTAICTSPSGDDNEKFNKAKEKTKKADERKSKIDEDEFNEKKIKAEQRQAYDFNVLPLLEYKPFQKTTIVVTCTSPSGDDNEKFNKAKEKTKKADERKSKIDDKVSERKIKAEKVVKLKGKKKRQAEDVKKKRQVEDVNNERQVEDVNNEHQVEDVDSGIRVPAEFDDSLHTQIKKSTKVEKRIDAKVKKSTKAEKRIDAKGKKSTKVEKRIDAKVKKSTKAEKRFDAKVKKSTKAEKRFDAKGKKSTKSNAERPTGLPKTADGLISLFTIANVKHLGERIRHGALATFGVVKKCFTVATEAGVWEALSGVVLTLCEMGLFAGWIVAFGIFLMVCLLGKLVWWSGTLVYVCCTMLSSLISDNQERMKKNTKVVDPKTGALGCTSEHNPSADTTQPIGVSNPSADTTQPIGVSNPSADTTQPIGVSNPAPVNPVRVFQSKRLARHHAEVYILHVRKEIKLGNKFDANTVRYVGLLRGHADEFTNEERRYIREEGGVTDYPEPIAC